MGARFPTDAARWHAKRRANGAGEYDSGRGRVPGLSALDRPPTIESPTACNQAVSDADELSSENTRRCPPVPMDLSPVLGTATASSGQTPKFGGRRGAELYYEAVGRSGRGRSPRISPRTPKETDGKSRETALAWSLGEDAEGRRKGWTSLPPKSARTYSTKSESMHTRTWQALLGPQTQRATTRIPPVPVSSGILRVRRGVGAERLEETTPGCPNLKPRGRPSSDILPSRALRTFPRLSLPAFSPSP